MIHFLEVLQGQDVSHLLLQLLLLITSLYTDYGLIYKHNLSNEIIADIKCEFADHLPYTLSFKGVVATWKVHVAKTNDKLKGTDLLSTCNFADENKVYYPNTHAILYSYCLFLSVLARANDPSVC